MKITMGKGMLLTAMLLGAGLFGQVQGKQAIAIETQDEPATISVPEDLLAYGEIRLSALDLKSIFDRAARVNPALGEFSVRMSVGGVVETLRTAGIDRIHIGVLARGLIPAGGVCVVMPCRDVEGVAALLNSMFAHELNAPQGALAQYVVVKRSDALVLCPRVLEAEFQGDGPLPRFGSRGAPSSPLQLVGDRSTPYPHFLAVELPAVYRDELVAMWPETLGEQSPLPVNPRRLAKHIDRLVLGWDLPPQMDMSLQVQCIDQGSAQEVKELIDQAIQMIPAQMPKPTTQLKDHTVLVGVSQTEMDRLIDSMASGNIVSAASRQDMNTIKQLSLAMHNYESAYGHIVGKWTATESQQRLLSWRVALLPFLGYQELYQRFRQNEPWDSEHNRALIAEMPAVFRISDDSLPAGKTRIHFPSVAGGLWHGEGPPRKFRDVTDGMSNTIWIAVGPEESAVEWTRPADWELTVDGLKEQFLGSRESAIFGLGDGSVQQITTEIDAATLLALLTMSGGEAVAAEQIK